MMMKINLDIKSIVIGIVLILISYALVLSAWVMGIGIVAAITIFSLPIAIVIKIYEKVKGDKYEEEKEKDRVL